MAVLVIEDATLRMMASNQRYLEILPCLATLADKLSDSGSPTCCNRKKVAETDVMQAMRNCVASIHRDKAAVAALKALLGADKIRVRRHLSTGPSLLTF